MFADITDIAFQQHSVTIVEGKFLRSKFCRVSSGWCGACGHEVPPI